MLWNIVRDEMTLKRLDVLRLQEQSIGPIEHLIEEYRNMILDSFENGD